MASSCLSLLTTWITGVCHHAQFSFLINHFPFNNINTRLSEGNTFDIFLKNKVILIASWSLLGLLAYAFNSSTQEVEAHICAFYACICAQSWVYTLLKQSLSTEPNLLALQMPCLCLLNVGITDGQHACLDFTWVGGILFQSSFLCSRHCTHCTMCKTKSHIPTR